jgi:hypothetical protein
MIKAVREGREACSDLSWLFKLDRTDPRMTGVGSTRRSWVEVVVIVVVVVVAGDDCVCARRLSGVTLGDNPTERKKRKIAREK